MLLGACSTDASPTAGDEGLRPGYAPLGEPSSTAPATPTPSSAPTAGASATATPTPSAPATSDTIDATDATDATDAGDLVDAVPQEPAPQLITFGGSVDSQYGLVVDVASARRALIGAPDDFVAFIGEVGRTARDDSAAERDRAGGVNVDVLRTDGYAAGHVTTCGGHAALWAEVDGTWREVAATQEAWPCWSLRRYAVPSAVLLGQQSCHDADGRRHTYLQD